MGKDRDGVKRGGCDAKHCTEFILNRTIDDEKDELYNTCKRAGCGAPAEDHADNDTGNVHISRAPPRVVVCCPTLVVVAEGPPLCFPPTQHH